MNGDAKTPKQYRQFLLLQPVTLFIPHRPAHSFRLATSKVIAFPSEGLRQKPELSSDESDWKGSIRALDHHGRFERVASADDMAFERRDQVSRDGGVVFQL